MDPAFEDVAFSLSVNDISEPVRSGFGWHLIEVSAIHAAKVRSFEESREDVLREYQSSQADEIFAEQVERLATLGFENPESLEVAAQALGLTIMSSEFFNLRGARAEGVTANPRVRAAAFSDDVLEAGNNSELIEIDGERRVMVRVAERKVQRQKDLNEVRDEIADSLKFEDSAKQAIAVGKRVLDGLRKGVSLATLAQDMSAELVAGSAQEPTLKWGNARTLTRDAPAGVPGSVAKLVFRMAPPANGSVGYEGIVLPSGGYAVIELSEVSQTPSQLSEEAIKAQRARLLGELQGGRGEQTFSAVQKSLRRQATVVIKQRNLRLDEG
jgi:peptidyl-prolyl cis-trans isomerase D